MSDKPDQEKFEIEEDEGREITISYEGEGDTIGIFADQAVVSHATGMFTFYFYQMQIPPLAKREVLLDLKELTATCVSRITLTPQLAEQFYNALDGNIKKYKARTDALQNKTEESSEGKEP